MQTKTLDPTLLKRAVNINESYNEVCGIEAMTIIFGYILREKYSMVLDKPNNRLSLKPYGTARIDVLIKQLAELQFPYAGLDMLDGMIYINFYDNPVKCQGKDYRDVAEGLLVKCTGGEFMKQVLLSGIRERIFKDLDVFDCEILRLARRSEKPNIEVCIEIYMAEQQDPEAECIVARRYIDTIMQDYVSIKSDVASVEPEHLKWMLEEICKKEMPKTKSSRWLGFVQGCLSHQGLIIPEDERNLTRSVFNGS